MLDCVTEAQAHYLLFIGKEERRVRTVTGLSHGLGVTKAAASVMVSKLERDGLLERDGRELKLTPRGKAVITELQGKQEEICAWMRRSGLNGRDLDKDALCYLLNMRPECVAATLAAAERQKLEEALALTAAEDFGTLLADGEYATSFTVYQEDGKNVSMGDMGFYHPAQLTVLNGRGVLKLRAKRLTMNVGPLKLRGILSGLSFWNGEEFCPVKRQDRSQEWRVPVPSCAVKWEPDGMRVALQIKARSSCGIAYMPESKAFLVFQISQIGEEEKNSCPKVRVG